MGGVLVVDKPQGITSFDVVRDVRRALGARKAGHTGTLDPMATGVLAVCLDDATRIAQYLTDGDKAYEAVVRLGAETDTLDAEGQVTARFEVPALSEGLLEAALTKFRGPQQQTPPMYSAVKVKGQRLYELARAGQEVERAARDVTVYALELRDFSATDVQFFVKASKGFFVRTLATDLARALGSGGHLIALRRVASGPFSIAQAVPLADIVADAARCRASLVSVETALAWLPEERVSAAAVAQVMHGVRLEVARPDGLVRVTGPDGALLALADVEHGKLVYRRVLASHAP